MSGRRRLNRFPAINLGRAPLNPPQPQQKEGRGLRTGGPIPVTTSQIAPRDRHKLQEQRGPRRELSLPAREQPSGEGTEAAEAGRHRRGWNDRDPASRFPLRASDSVGAAAPVALGTQAAGSRAMGTARVPASKRARGARGAGPPAGTRPWPPGYICGSPASFGVGGRSYGDARRCHEMRRLAASFCSPRSDPDPGVLARSSPSPQQRPWPQGAWVRPEPLDLGPGCPANRNPLVEILQAGYVSKSNSK